MARCSHCNKLMLSPSDSRYCKYCEIVVQKEARHKAEVQEKHAEEQRRKEEELKKNNDAQRSVARIMNLYEETLRNAEETRKQKIEEERKQIEQKINQLLEEGIRAFTSYGSLFFVLYNDIGRKGYCWKLLR